MNNIGVAVAPVFLLYVLMRITNYELRITNYELRITYYELIKLQKSVLVIF